MTPYIQRALAIAANEGIHIKAQSVSAVLRQTRDRNKNIADSDAITDAQILAAIQYVRATEGHHFICEADAVPAPRESPMSKLERANAAAHERGYKKPDLLGNIEKPAPLSAEEQERIRKLPPSMKLAYANEGGIKVR